MPAPILLFTYNRYFHTKATVEALQKNKLASDSKLIIYSDGPRSNKDLQEVNRVRSYLNTVDGFKEVKVYSKETNFGLAESIIGGVTEALNIYDQIIVLEDDHVTSPFFLDYMNQNLVLYSDTQNIASIHGYVYPVQGLPSRFFLRGADCWGWGTWKRAWRHFNPNGQELFDQLKRQKLLKSFNFDNSFNFSGMLKSQIKGKNDSWAIRWYASAFLKEMLTLYPGTSYVHNIGNDASGTHNGDTSVFDTSLFLENYNEGYIKPLEDLVAKAKIIDYFKLIREPLYKKLRSKVAALFR